jgi:hypothetical protein
LRVSTSSLTSTPCCLSVTTSSWARRGWRP